ncbi:serine/threonine-protein kinase [Streptomyces sp. NPDC101206]|uniref:serine/threonine-protein kinase n=1 Tax=Streptomyces sp. NPDC101206 TaxID=3366128 RepID=UPI00380E99AE
MGTYELLERLGEGGMGEVFLGRSPSGRRVAVKVVRAEVATDPGFRARFRREVAAARAVPAIWTAPVVDCDPDAERPWVASQYIDAPDLARLVERDGPLTIPALRLLGAQLAEALGYVHRAGLVHRDLKPGNVLMADDGPRLIDFGIAKAIEPVAGVTALTGDHVIGTPGFMSPEQVTGRVVGPPSDVFSLAGVLLFAATGAAPFGHGTIETLLYRVVNEEPDLDVCPQELRPLLGQCLAKNPADRPTTQQLMQALATDTQPWGHPAPPPDPPDSPTPATAPITAADHAPAKVLGSDHLLRSVSFRRKHTRVRSIQTALTIDADGVTWETGTLPEGTPTGRIPWKDITQVGFVTRNCSLKIRVRPELEQQYGATTLWTKNPAVILNLHGAPEISPTGALPVLAGEVDEVDRMRLAQAAIRQLAPPRLSGSAPSPRPATDAATWNGTATVLTKSAAARLRHLFPFVMCSVLPSVIPWSTTPWSRPFLMVFAGLAALTYLLGPMRGHRVTFFAHGITVDSPRLMPGRPTSTVVAWADITELTWLEGESEVPDALHLRLRPGAIHPSRQRGVVSRPPRVVIKLPAQTEAGRKRHRKQVAAALNRSVPHLEPRLP